MPGVLNINIETRHMKLTKVEYSRLNARQKENYNCMKLVGKLADYGYVTMRLTDDWEGADLIACHIDGQTYLRIQLKARCCFYKKYHGKDLWIAFRDGEDWFLFPHDEVLETIRMSGKLDGTQSWDKQGGYSFPRLSFDLKVLLAPFELV